MPFYKIISLSLCFLLGCNLAFSQNYPVKNYTSANELPNNSVRSLLLDSNNILWIGTENGVVKKENDIFQYFFEEDGLALNSCWAIAEDNTGKIWFGSYGGGLSIYDGFEFRTFSEDDGLIHNEIIRLFYHDDRMYVGTSDGLAVIDINSFSVHNFRSPAADELFRVTDFFEYRKQIYVATYKSGMFRISEEKGLPTLIKQNDHINIYSVFADQDSVYSSNKGYYTKNALAAYVKEYNPAIEEKLGFSIIWDHIKTEDNKIFAAAWGIYDTNGGIYEIVNGQMISRASEFNVPSKEVISLAYDRKFEKLYAGTKDAGLFEIALNPQIKFNEVPGKNVLGFARTTTTSAILFNDGIAIKGVSTPEVISLQQLKKWQENYLLTTKLPLPKHENDFYELDHSTKAEDIGFYDIKALGNTYWVNTNIGIFAINEHAELQLYLPLHTEEINFTAAEDLIETNPYGGVRVYQDPDALEYKHFDQFDTHTPTMVVGSLKKEEKTYFLSVFSGLFTWEDAAFRSYLEDGTWKEKKLKHITTLENNLAISNEFGDVFILNDESTFKILKKIPRAAIQGNTISFLKEYLGTLIIGTEKGLTLYKNDRFIFIDKEQGLEQPLLSAEVHENILSIGSKNGVYKIDLDAFNELNPFIDQINLKEVFVNNNRTALGPLEPGAPLNLEHNQNTVLLRFSTNAHPYPNKLNYQYRLNPAENWSLPSSKPEIFLASLPNNSYNVEVKISDQSTGLSYTQPLLNMVVLPPFWKTWWFISLLTFLLILSVFSIYRIQIMQTRKFEEQKGLIQKRFEETKMEALLSQMNPHFIFNAMNSIQYYIMESDIDKATVFLGDFAKLIRLNLDHCTKPTILLIEEIEYLQSYVRVENTRFNNIIKIDIDIDPAIDVYDVEIPTMILQTFVENVFVHAFPAGIKDPSLKISFKMVSNDILQCRIDDNGIGYAPHPTNKLHRSRGVSLVKERLALLGYNVEEAIEVISVKNKGTSIVLNLQV